MSRFRWIVIAFGFASASFVSHAAFASIQTRNDSTVGVPDGGYITGSGNLLFDTETGLEWLDVTLTLGRSYNDVLANLILDGGQLSGFRYASAEELATFWSHAGLVFPNLSAEVDSTAIGGLQAEWGITYQRSGIDDDTFAITGTFVGPPISGYIAGHLSNRYEESTPDLAHIENGHYVAPSEAVAWYGSALVRHSTLAEVPEPASVIVWSILAVISVSIVRLRRKTQPSFGEANWLVDPMSTMPTSTITWVTVVAIDQPTARIQLTSIG